jgi:uncharacterized membrane protein
MTTPIRRVPLAVVLVAVGLVAVGLLLILLAVILPGLATESKDQRLREIHQCEMQHALAGSSVVEAELLCARPWEQ